MTSLVTARGVSKQFGKVRAVDNVSFDIEKGKILGLKVEDITPSARLVEDLGAG